MADSSARTYYQYMNEPVPEVKTPKRKVSRSRPVRKNNVNLELNLTTLPLSRSEKIIISVGTLISLALMFFLVTSTISSTSTQRQLQNVNSEVAVTKSENLDLEQEIGELTSIDRINQIAKQQGLKLIESNIRTIHQ